MLDTVSSVICSIKYCVPESMYPLHRFGVYMLANVM